MITPPKSFKAVKAAPTLAPSKNFGFTVYECIDSLTNQGIPLSDIKGEHMTVEIDKLTYKPNKPVEFKTTYYFRNEKCYKIEYMYENKESAMNFLNKLKADKTLKQPDSKTEVWDSSTENISYIYSDEEPGKYYFWLTIQK